MKKKILSLLTVISIISTMVQIPVFAAEETVSENASNSQVQDELYLSSDEEADEFKLKDEYTENEPNEDLSASQSDNVNYESTADIDNSSDIELMSIVASGNCGANGDNVIWTLDSNGRFTVSGSGDMEDYNNGYTYAPWYSNEKDIKSIVIEYGVNSVGKYAFFECYNVTSVTLPSSMVRIGELAFCHCTSLTGITIPSNVINIGKNAFGGCNILNINVSGSNPNYCDIDGVLFSKDKKEIITYTKDKIQPSYTIPSNVVSICDSAFSGCKSLTNVIIPSSVISIGIR